MSLTTEPPGPHEGQLEPHARVALRFEPAGTAVRVPPGVTVFDAASWNGIAIDSTCGGHGTCKKCRVRVVDGVSPPTDLDAGAYGREELAAGWRLACRAVAQSDLRVEVPPLETRPKAATVGVGRQVILRPALQKRYVELDEPTLQDQRTDLERLRDAMEDLELHVSAGALRRLPGVLRDSSFRVTAVVVDETLIDVEPGDTTDSLHAIAFDLGTTTVVATLLDIATGTPVSVASKLNHQQPFGADVISRISATMLDDEALARLCALAQQTLRELAEEVCADAGLDPSHVYEVALAGNVTMTQLALGIDAEPVGVAPFVAVTRAYPELPASELGLEHSPARTRNRVPVAWRVRGWRHRRWTARDGHDAGSPVAPVHRCGNELRARAWLHRADRLHRGASRPGVRSGADQVRDARRTRRGGIRARSGRLARAGRDRGRQAARPVRVRPRGRCC